MNKHRRTFLKYIGISGALSGLGGLSFWFFSRSNSTVQQPYKYQKLIIDPEADKFIYRDGVVIFKES